MGRTLLPIARVRRPIPIVTLSAQPQTSPKSRCLAPSHTSLHPSPYPPASPAPPPHRYPALPHNYPLHYSPLGENAVNMPSPPLSIQLPF